MAIAWQHVGVTAWQHAVDFAWQRDVETVWQHVVVTALLYAVEFAWQHVVVKLLDVDGEMEKPSCLQHCWTCHGEVTHSAAVVG